MLVLLVSVALLGAMVLFIGHSLRTMTATAVRSASLDWQGPVGSATAATRVAARVAKQPGIAAAEPVATAPFAGAQHTAPAGTIRAGAGFVVAVPPRYQSELHTFRMLHGSLQSDGHGGYAPRRLPSNTEPTPNTPGYYGSQQ